VYYSHFPPFSHVITVFFCFIISLCLPTCSLLNFTVHICKFMYINPFALFLFLPLPWSHRTMTTNFDPQSSKTSMQMQGSPTVSNVPNISNSRGYRWSISDNLNDRGTISDSRTCWTCQPKISECWRTMSVRATIRSGKSIYYQSIINTNIFT
jgi:hypothetical protein